MSDHEGYKLPGSIGYSGLALERRSRVRTAMRKWVLNSEEEPLAPFVWPFPDHVDPEGVHEVGVVTPTALSARLPMHTFVHTD